MTDLRLKTSFGSAAPVAPKRQPGPPCVEGLCVLRDILDGVPPCGELAHTLLCVTEAALGHEAR